MDQAISAYQRAYDIARNIGWEPGLSKCLCHLGRVKLEQGMRAEAEELLRESVRIARNSHAAEILGMALYWLGKCFHAQARHEEAISALEESSSVYQNLGPNFGLKLADTAALLADCKSTLGHKQEALAWYDTAIAEGRKGGYGYEGVVSECLAKKDAILTEMKRGDEGSLHGETPS
ncbi:hypothetical protein M407DRAFT_246559 [Tulasnella calospora MUT 4182]|uniref:Uncharacterized protein n=1 Tax=Tulasnella calospora MUT 4182 TaxID=1051891 RepID=A0A0C3K9Q7_9AGAM|nr:hypothetical protein M407DRAFT_246559 [Tulasnella calospora MUT 4182]